MTESLPEAVAQLLWVRIGHLFVGRDDNVIVITTERCLLGTKGFPDLTFHAVTVDRRTSCLERNA